MLPPRAVVALFRAPDAQHFERASQVLRDAGVTCQEYTLTTDGALDALVRTRKALGDLVLGIGSVRTVEDLRAAADAGADFAVSQIFLPELVGRCRRTWTVLHPRSADADRGHLGLEPRGADRQGVARRSVGRAGLPEGTARAHAGRRGDADWWDHPGSSCASTYVWEPSPSVSADSCSAMPC